jgi:hypothetical protein
MASKKFNTDPKRFRVERIDGCFAIFDTTEWKYTLCSRGTSRFEAEQECVARNGDNRPKASESSAHQTFRDKFHSQGKGVTSEDIEEYFGDSPKECSLGLNPQTLQAQRLMANIKTWLPPILKAWANEVTEQLGYGGTMRNSWYTYLVVKAIRQEGHGRFTFTSDAIANLHYEVWPTFDWGLENLDSEARSTLCVHYLSADPAHIKAAYFGLSEREYYRQVGAAHQGLARSWLIGTGEHAICQAQDAHGVSEDDETNEDDDYQWAIDPDDLANFSW